MKRMRSWHLLLCISICLLSVKSEIETPLNLTSPYQTYNSVELEWDPPPENYANETNEGSSPSVTSIHYTVTFSPPLAVNGSSCGWDVVCTTNSTWYRVTGLQFGVAYTFVVHANLSSTGQVYSDNVTVLVPGNVPPSVSTVNLCLHHNKTTELLLHATPCPPVISNPDVTPPINGYELSVNGSVPVKLPLHSLCSDRSLPVTEGLPYTVGVSTYNMVGSSTVTESEMFYASWIRNVDIQHSNQTLVIQYKTASCVAHKGMRVQLSLNIGHFSSMNYIPNDDRVFVLHDIRKSTPLIITLQVVDRHNGFIGQQQKITLYPVTGTPTPTTPPTIAVPNEEELSMYSLRIIIGIVGGTVLVLLVTVIALFFIVKKFRKRLKFQFSGDEEFEYRTPRSGSSDPSTSRSLSCSLSDSIYDDMEIHKQNPMCVWVPNHEKVVTNASSVL